MQKTKHCNHCNRDLLIEDFPWKNKAKGKRGSRCIECQREYSREHYRKNRTQYKEWRKVYRAETKALVQEYKKSRGCSVCGETHIACLDFHHKDGEEKEFAISQMLSSQGRERVFQEIAKCVVLCANCHRKLHWEGQH